MNAFLIAAVVLAAVSFIYFSLAAHNTHAILHKPDLPYTLSHVSEPGPKLAKGFVKRTLLVLPRSTRDYIMNSFEYSQEEKDEIDNHTPFRMPGFLYKDSRTFKGVVNKMLDKSGSSNVAKILKKRHAAGIKYSLNDRFKNDVKSFGSIFTGVYIASLLGMGIAGAAAIAAGLGFIIKFSLIQLILGGVSIAASAIGTILGRSYILHSENQFLRASFASADEDAMAMDKDYKPAIDIFEHYQEALGNFAHKALSDNHDSVLQTAAREGDDTLEDKKKKAEPKEDDDFADIIIGYDTEDDPDNVPDDDNGENVTYDLSAAALFAAGYKSSDKLENIASFLSKADEAKIEKWVLAKDGPTAVSRIGILALIDERLLAVQAGLYFIALRDSTMYSLKPKYPRNVMTSMYMSMMGGHLDDQLIALIDGLSRDRVLHILSNNDLSGHKDNLARMGAALFDFMQAMIKAIGHEQAGMTMLTSDMRDKMKELGEEDLMDDEALLSMYSGQQKQADKMQKEGE